MKVLTLLWLLAYAITPSAFARAAGNALPKSWAGCYELSVAPADEEKELWGRLPLWFQLLTKPNGPPLKGVQWFKTRTIDNPLGPLDGFFPPSWKPDSEDVAFIGLGSGFVGYSLKITRSGGILAGTAKPTSDDGVSHSSFPFGFVRVACK